MQTDGPKVGKSREKLHFLSLKFDFPPPLHIQLQNERRCLFFFSFYSHFVPHLPLVKSSLAHWISPSTYPPIFDFPPIRRCHMSPMGPTLELKWPDSAPDTWHTVSHSKCAKCPALCLLPRKMCKFRLSQNSTKFDVVARFRKTIPTVKSVSSSKI